MPNIHRAEGIYIRKDQRSAVRKRSAEFPHTQILRLVWSYGKCTPTKMRYSRKHQNKIGYTLCNSNEHRISHCYTYNVSSVDKNRIHIHLKKPKMRKQMLPRHYTERVGFGRCFRWPFVIQQWSIIQPTFLSNNIRIQMQNDSDIRGIPVNFNLTCWNMQLELDSQIATLCLASWKQIECSRTWDRWLA